MKTTEDQKIDKHFAQTMKRGRQALKKAQTALRKCRMAEELRNPDVMWNQLKTPAPIPVSKYQRDTADEILRRALKGMDKSLKK